ncbi:MAG: TonB-dependent receptor, partial [Prevotellaceae bacterium]|nr:TonB-dependent receptor [Prevotellaceae bacterium]
MRKKYWRQRFLRTTISFLFSIAFFAASAQTSYITGTVTDAQTNETLPGVTIIVDGTTLGANTDHEGNFKINLKSGVYSLTVSYISYKTINRSNVTIEPEKETKIDFRLNPADLSLKEVEVMGKVNRESENMLLLEQRQALVATQAVGAREMSRKGAGNAEAAVTKVSGISKQEGVKNVFVRGLGDRYNSTTLNGFPVPSEDPEYKNIALEFFGTDVIQSIDISKVFSSSNYGDVGGAVININSKELVGDKALSIEGELGTNTAGFGGDFLTLDGGGGYLGFTKGSTLPKPETGSKYIDNYDFKNSLDPKSLNMGVNHSYGIAGGRIFFTGENKNPLSFFLVASYDSKYSYTEEIVRNSGSTNENVDIDLKGKRYSKNVSQLVLGNINWDLNRKHRILYNFMLVHANSQFLGDYAGLNINMDNDGREVFLRRQQVNDNILTVNQLISSWNLSERIKFDAGASYNSVKGSEPDRRINVLVNNGGGKYQYVLGNEQKRFFSVLDESDFNVKTSFSYKLPDNLGKNNSQLQIGYSGRFLTDNFEASDYDSNPVSGYFDVGNLKMDEHYNQENLKSGAFWVEYG